MASAAVVPSLMAFGGLLSAHLSVGLLWAGEAAREILAPSGFSIELAAMTVAATRRLGLASQHEA